MDASDERLVGLAGDGDPAAFRMLVERHSHYVTSIASRFLLSEDDTRDVVQDAFIKVWRNLGNYDSRSLFTTWLYTVVANLCLDRLKINRRRREIGLTGEGLGEIANTADTVDPVQMIDSGALGRAVRDYAAGLSNVQRQVFVLRDLQDLPVDEVCRITGYDTDKVKSNLYHARKYMREKLSKGGYL